ncbi:hypothetical protein [Deinococcus sonorensis]|uniref:Uncharacterized protein n=1 Tax=Deinococcus sonorensis TaxID=309891 RepID=A0ABV8YBH5_9DEIO
MDYAAKHCLLRQEFEAFRQPLEGAPWVEPEFLIPAAQALRFLRRLAALDIALLSGVELLDPQPDDSLLVQEMVVLGGDRALGLTEAAHFVRRHVASPAAMIFTYDVFDDIPLNERATVLRENPRLCAQSTAEHQVAVTVTGIAALRAAMDLVWHHVRLVQVRVVQGPTLNLASDLGRYEQLELVTAWIRHLLPELPEAEFCLMGTLLSYTSPLPEDQWLLPYVFREE